MLQFGMRPPFSFVRFLEICKDKISQEDIGLIKLTREGYLYAGIQPTLLSPALLKERLPVAQATLKTRPSVPLEKQGLIKRWCAFEIALRNELVKIRASRKHIDPLKYLRGDDYIEPYITHIAMNAHRNPSLLEAERLLDQERWRALDELAVGHYFDLDVLIVYALKLLILERWGRINSADKTLLVNQTLN